MKRSEVPDSAWSEKPTPIPTKQVYDWDKLHDILVKKGFVVIESTNIRIDTHGTVECVEVRAFLNHLRYTKRIPLRTKRISDHRWACTL